MRLGMAFLWILAAVAEGYRRIAGALPEPFHVVGPWFVLLLTVVPLVGAVREFREGERSEGIKSSLWALLGIVTLLFGPGWLRFGG
ncbi:MAG: hypothetical protein QN172_03505 [Armatimonadota bacterium]|nr:hypothetical protein [Armatimonadota bacterium]MDR7568695.1 hypothetical protein [Armatimonadota bacterium]MDR7601507.1 hypothetical protein [Armatimonadota bacterium]